MGLTRILEAAASTKMAESPVVARLLTDVAVKRIGSYKRKIDNVPAVGETTIAPQTSNSLSNDFGGNGDTLEVTEVTMTRAVRAGLIAAHNAKISRLEKVKTTLAPAPAA